MAQADVMAILAERPGQKWTYQDLQDRLGLTRSSLHCNIRKCLRDPSVDSEVMHRPDGTNRGKYIRRIWLKQSYEG